VAEQLQAAAEEEVALPDSVDAVPGERGEGLVLASYAEGSDPDTVFAPDGRFGPDAVAARSPELDLLIARYADHYEVPERLVRRVVDRESTFNPAARNGPYWGLMQILPQTARTMGHAGPPEELLDAETNLKYAVRYLRGAYLTAGGDEDQAVRLYARGYYYDAKAAGLLDETGLGRDRRRMR
jgi:soluble lytic murein transglycosylase-like protein